ncbi:MAG: helix-turn-helix transcriptional regulator [Candidatus Saccharimonadaceae bacterium]
MDLINSSQRLESIYQMLLEMAAGNFDLKISHCTMDDELQRLIVLINIIAKDIRSNIFYTGYVNSHFAIQYLVQNTIILNQNFVIKSYSHNTIRGLGLNSGIFYETVFDDIIAEESLDLWSEIREEIILNNQYHKTMQITYKSANGLLVPAFCTISRLLHSNKILVSSVSIVVENDVERNPILLNSRIHNSSLRNYDVKIIQKLYDYIVSNLDSPLPTLSELSSKFGTNEHYLKVGFRHFFKISIYKFYNEERLKRAHLLIQQTTLPLNTIAYMSGFNVYSNFSKSFKKKFLYSPSTLKRGR